MQFLNGLISGGAVINVVSFWTSLFRLEVFNDSFLTSVMVDVLTEILIDRSLREVSRYASDPGKAPEWYENIISAEWRTQGLLKLGSEIAFTAHFLGKKLSYTYKVVEMSEHRFVMKTAEGPFPMETSYEWEQVSDNCTRMKLRNRGNPSGFSKLVAPFMAIMMRKANMKDLKKLKSILEANGN